MSQELFGTDGIRGRVGQAPMSPDWMIRFGYVTGMFFRTTERQTVLVARDTRESSLFLQEALILGMRTAGMHVIDMALCPTPGLAYALAKGHYAYGVMITASHNPYYDNGVKVFNAHGHKLTEQQERLLSDKLKHVEMTWQFEQLGTVLQDQTPKVSYTEACQKLLEDVPAVPHLIIDCAHGAMTEVAPQVLQGAAQTLECLAVSPTGLNINQACGATAPQTLQARVLEQGASLGFAFDGDGDRVIAVDAQGRVCDGDVLAALLYAYLHHEKKAVEGIIGTVMSNGGLDPYLKGFEGRLVRTQVGDKHLVAMQERMGETYPLAAEPSGHIIARPWFDTGDGLQVACLVLKALAALKTDLACFYDQLPLYQQHHLALPVQHKATAEHPSVVHGLNQLRAGLEGRIVVRASGTEPVIRLMVEGPQASSEQHQAILKELKALILMHDRPQS